ncbi:lipopolysaccharide biosynthesis protein [Aureimonas sp. SK2]|uniref:lipopolysaccharide biosynthesis protein n=1 Tax=Aureimonas sp. SK2 TaxID=3015992 RepID=UPI002443E29A|nr:polysaccharide biosynthesis C-terminal domain-containing protein [Aureimonas sp. SK2]
MSVTTLFGRRLPARLASRDLSSLFHLGLRMATLGLRFALAFWVVGVLGYEASGVYGLALGAIGIIPAAVGWGLNYFCARDVVGASAVAAAGIIKARLLVTAVSLAACLVLALPLLHAFDLPADGLVVLIAVLVVFETIGLDVHMPLLSLGKGRLANLLVFVRSALWVPLVIGGGWLVPELNSLQAVFLFWIAFHVLGVAILVVAVPRATLEAAWRVPLRRDWIADRLRRSWSIYLSDLGIVAMLFADRYVVTALLGLDVAGLYTFYWSLTNALQTLLATAIVQVLFPTVLGSFAGGNAGALAAEIRRQTLRVSAIAAVLAAGLLVAGEVAGRFLPGHDMTGTRSVFWLLVLAAVVRTLSELLNFGLTAMEKDGHYAALNVFGMVLSLTLAYGLIEAFGFVGVGLASLITALVLYAGRLMFLRRFLREAAPA